MKKRVFGVLAAAVMAGVLTAGCADRSCERGSKGDRREKNR